MSRSFMGRFWYDFYEVDRKLSDDSGWDKEHCGKKKRNCGGTSPREDEGIFNRGFPGRIKMKTHSWRMIPSDLKNSMGTMVQRFRFSSNSSQVLAWKQVSPTPRPGGTCPAADRDLPGCKVGPTRLQGGTYPVARWDLPGCKVGPTRLQGGTHPAARWKPPGCEVGAARWRGGSCPASRGSQLALAWE
jgi:hypothetical protein